MIYLKDTTGFQEVRIPHTGLEASGLAVLELSATFNGEPIGIWGATLRAGEAYHTARLALPAGTPKGEYYYALKQDGIRVAAGLAVVGEPSRIAEPGAGSGISTISIKQYGEE